MRVLVLDGNQNQAVTCARSLARAGHSVWAGESTPWSKAGWSKYCSGSFTYPFPEKDAVAFVERIAIEASRDRGTFVLPLTERTTLPLSTHRELICSAGARMVLPPHDVVLQAFDKLRTTRLAESLGLAVPQSVLIENKDQARELSRIMRYPAVLKPRTSERVTPEGGVKPTGRPKYATNAQEFMNAWKALAGHSGEVLAQEFVEGAGEGYFALMREGELRAEFAHRRIRDVRPTGSGSSLRVSVLPSPRLREAGLAILRALAWHGVAMVEFRARPDGTPVFMEVNGRFWNSLALAVYAGVDFPALLARMAERGDVSAPCGYREGVRCRWLVGDLRHLIEVWRGVPAGYPGQFPGRLRTLSSFFLPVPGTFHDNFTWRDPLPELGDWIDFFFRRLPAELKKRGKKPKQEEPEAERRYSHP